MNHISNPAHFSEWPKVGRKVYSKLPLPDEMAEGRVGCCVLPLSGTSYTVLSLGGFACESILETTLILAV